MSNHAINVSEADFKQTVMDAGIPVVIDFWAEWCGPCRMMAPAFDAAAEKLAGKVRFVKVNVDENPSIAAGFGVQAIPTMVIVEGGREKARMVGVLSKERLLSAVEQHVGVAVA